jgi:hypothetical protein
MHTSRRPLPFNQVSIDSRPAISDNRGAFILRVRAGHFKRGPGGAAQAANPDR